MTYARELSEIASAITVDGSKNIGIGTASPYQAKLDVKGVGGTGSVANIGATNANDDQLLIGSINRASAPAFFSLPNGSAFVGAIGNGVANTLGVGTYGAAPLVLGTSNTERMRIDSSGNVGIGTSSPNVKLVVYQNIANAPAKVRVETAASGNYFDYASVGVTAIGVSGGLTAWSTGSARAGSMWLGTDASNPLVFGTADTERMRISGAGNVGIGTSTPSFTLDVQQASATIGATSTTGTNIAYVFASNSGSSFIIGKDNSGGGLTGVAYGNFLWTSGNQPITFSNNSTEKMRIDASGNVGIGFSSPTQRLQVFNGAGLPTKVYVQSDLNFAGSYIGTANSNRGAAIELLGHTDAVNSDGFKLQYANDFASQSLTFSYANPQTSYGALSYNERVRITSAGSLFVATGGVPSLGPGMSGQLVVGTSAYGARQVTLDCSNGAMFIQGNSGGWGMGMYAVGSSGAQLGGFGWLGGANALSYYWVGQSYAGTGVSLSYGGNSWAALSDARDKNVVGTIENAIDKVNQIRPVYYKYKTDSEDQGRRIGFIAQEVQAVLPEAVTEQQRELDNPTEDTKRLVLAYTDTLPLLLAAIQEQQVMIEELKAKVAALEAA